MATKLPMRRIQYAAIQIAYSLVSLLTSLYFRALKYENTRRSSGISGLLYYIAASTASFCGMLGMPPLCSVDRLAAVDAKAPM